MIINDNNHNTFVMMIMMTLMITVVLRWNPLNVRRLLNRRGNNG